VATEYNSHHTVLDESDDLMDQTLLEMLLEIYDWEKMDPKERWEQEQIQELERFENEIVFDM
jgi:hypothetical protein